MFMNMYVHGYVYVYDSICWALKCLVHCAEPFLELKICISPQFRAIDPPNPARGFIQQNENVRFATAACMQKYGNVSFATVACAKCMRYGGRGGDPYHGGGGGGATRDTEPYIEMFTSIYMYFKMSICIMYMSCVFLIVYIIYLYVFLFSSRCISYILYSNILSYNTFVFASFSCNMLQMLVNIDLSIPCSLHASTTACSPILSHEGHGAR